MTTKPLHLLLIAGLVAGSFAVPVAGRGDCLRMRINGVGTAEPQGREVEDRKAAVEKALALAIHNWEANAIQDAGDAFHIYGAAQNKIENCVPLQRNIMSTIRCEVTATPCQPD